MAHRPPRPDAGDVGGNGLAEAGGEGRVRRRRDCQPSGQAWARGDLRQVAAGLDRQGLGLGDGLAGILGVELPGAGLGRPGGLRRGDEAQRRKRHDVLAYGPRCS